jgi:hypothetical protein
MFILELIFMFVSLFHPTYHAQNKTLAFKTCALQNACILDVDVDGCISRFGLLRTVFCVHVNTRK